MNIGCPICRHSFVDAKECVATACGHLFDRDCIVKWMQAHSRPAKCPTCRQNIDGLTRIYFTAIPDGSSVKKKIMQLELKVAQRELNCLTGRNLSLNQKYFNLFTKSKEMEYLIEQLKEKVGRLEEENQKLKMDHETKETAATEQKKMLDESKSENLKLETKVLFLKNQYFKNDQIKHTYIKLSKDYATRKESYKKLAIDYRIQINDLYQEIEGLKTEIEYLDVHRAITNPFCEDETIAKLEEGFLKQAHDEIKNTTYAKDPFVIRRRMAHLVHKYRNKFVVDAQIALKNLESLYIKYGKPTYSSSSSLAKACRSAVMKARVPFLPRSSTRTDLTAASGFEDWSWEF